MEDFILSLLLLDITKRDMKLVLILYTLYMDYLKTEEGKGFKIRDISNLTGFTSTAVIASLENLVCYNIVGKIGYSNSLSGKKTKGSFNEAFLDTLKDPKNAIKEAATRAGYYITDDDVLYIFNPFPDTWKYPTWKKVEKIANKLNKAVNNRLLNNLLDNDKKGKNTLDGTKINGMSVPKSLAIFGEKYRATYNAKYAFNYGAEFSIIKRLLKQFESNNIPGTQYPAFLDFAFNKAVNRGSTLAVNHLKYYANDFMANATRTGTDGYYYDDDGKLKRKT